MITKTADTFWANIYVGLKDTDISKARGHNVDYPITLVEDICRDYCDGFGFCVTVTPTKYVYSFGAEHGAIVGVINYPRFPEPIADLKDRALTIAEMLRVGCHQYRVTVVMADETVMLCRPGTKE